MDVVRHDETRLESFDGTDLAVQVAGEGPLVVLANGLGGSLRAWGPLLQRFAPGHRIASWDYRGLYRSGPPATRDAVTIDDHVRDLDAVMTWLGGGPAVLIGWSMGVQVIVQYTLDQPEKVGGLALVAGAPGDPLAGIMHTRASRWIIPPLTCVVQAAAAPFGLAMRGLTAPSFAPEVLRAAGVVAPSADLGAFGELASEFGRLDWKVYMRTIRAMARHDAWSRLGEIAVPTLVVGGTADLFLPVATTEAMAAAIPGAELLLLHGATHYLPVEFPDALNERLERFLIERVAVG